MIELKQTSKTYEVNGKKVEAVKDVSLTIEKGEVFGVIGYSGAGKSTLIRCVNLLEKPTSGEVFINGVSLTTLSKQDLQRHAGKSG